MPKTLADRWKEARLAAGLGMNELDRLIEQSSGYTSRMERGEKLEAAVGIVAHAARVLGVRLAWLVDGEEPRARVVPDAPDPHIGEFLLKMRRLPGLEEWVEKHPERLTISQLAKGMHIYETVKPSSRSDGLPAGGWDTFFDDALSGKLVGKKPGNQAAAEALERQQMTNSGVKRLRSTSTKQ